MSINDIDSFADLLHTFRKRARFTQQQLAEAVGMHRHEISRWEQGSVLPASKAIVLELAHFLRLNDQEARQLLDASLTAPVSFWCIPFPRNLLFTGREAILETLHIHLGGSQIGAATLQASALQGLGGVGKTQIALEYAYRHALEYRAIFWIEAETTERVLFSLQRIAEVLQLPASTATDQHQMVDAVQRWLATHSDWLLIWDNLEDLELPQRTLSPTLQGAFLFTTRRQVLGTLARGIEVPPMECEDGMLLLLRRAKVLEPGAKGKLVHQLASRMPDDSAAAAKLVITLGGLPLALDQAGAYLEETGCSLTDYQRRYEQQRALLLDRRGSLNGHHQQSVMATFLLALEQIEREQTAVADLLRVWAFLHAEAISEDLFSAGAASLGAELAPLVTDPFRFDQALGTLQNLSLIQRRAQTHTLSLHRLIQAVLQDQMEPDEASLWCERVIRLVNAAFPEPTFSTWAQCERCLAHALVCMPLIEMADRELPEAGELIQKAGSYLMERGRYKEAEPLLEQALALGEKHSDSEAQVLTPRLMRRAELFWRQGQYASAEPLLQRILAIEEQTLGPEHPDVAETLNNLALLFWQQGKYEAAEPLYQRALRIQEQQFGPEHPDVCETLNNLALLYTDQGRYAQAEQLYQQALHMQERLSGSESPRMANKLDNLARLYRLQDKCAQAESLYQRALRMQEQQLGPEHPRTLLTLVKLAHLYRHQGKYELAEPLYQRVLRMGEPQLGHDHPDMAQAFFGLANLYRDQGKYKLAEPLYQQALQAQEQKLGAEHSTTVTTLNALAHLSWRQARYEQAKFLYQRVLDIKNQRQGAEDLALIDSLCGLGRVYLAQGDVARALSLLQRALTLAQMILGAHHTKTAICRSALGELYLKQGQKEPAEVYLQQALAVFQEILEPAHPERACCQAALAKLTRPGGKRPAT